MMIELSVTQIAARLGVSERTVQRRIRQGTIHVVQARVGRYEVDEDELSAFAQDDPDELTALKIEVASLRDRVEELERLMRVEQETGPGVKPAKVVRRPVNGKAENGKSGRVNVEEMELASTFAQLHGVSRDRMRNWIQVGDVRTTAVPYGDGERVRHYLDQQQQCEAVFWWEAHEIEYKPCESCPHI